MDKKKLEKILEKLKEAKESLENEQKYFSEFFHVGVGIPTELYDAIKMIEEMLLQENSRRK
ncbi:MAG: hypothetical protein Q6363_005745 [Candidatus Njordarchaeota archaeon]